MQDPIDSALDSLLVELLKQGDISPNEVRQMKEDLDMAKKTRRKRNPNPEAALRYTSRAFVTPRIDTPPPQPQTDVIAGSLLGERINQLHIEISELEQICGRLTTVADRLFGSRPPDEASVGHTASTCTLDELVWVQERLRVVREKIGSQVERIHGL